LDTGTIYNEKKILGEKVCQNVTFSITLLIYSKSCNHNTILKHISQVPSENWHSW